MKLKYSVRDMKELSTIIKQECVDCASESKIFLLGSCASVAWHERLLYQDRIYDCQRQAASDNTR